MSHVFRVLLLFLIGVMGTGALGVRAQAEGADTLTATAAVRQALTDNPTVQAVRQQRAAAAASVREARRAWLPVVQGQAQYRRLSTNVDYTVDLPSGVGQQPVTFAPAILDRYAVRATVEQPVFTGRRVPNQVAGARAETRAAQAQLTSTRSDVAYRARAAYWGLYEARARRRAAADALRLLERRLTDVQNERAAGRATEAEVLRVQARRDQVRVERIQARTAAASARRALNDQRGRPLDAPVVLADTVTVDAAAALPSDPVPMARAQRSDLDALRQTVRARAAAVQEAQAGWFPQVSLVASTLYARPNEQLFPPEDRFQTTWEAGVTLSWRLSAGIGAVADRARARRQQAQYELQDRQRAVAAEVRDQVENVDQAREAVQAATTSVESARAAYRATQSRYEAGMAVISDLLDAERALREARAALATAQADYALAQAALDRALGRSPLPAPRTAQP